MRFLAFDPGEKTGWAVFDTTKNPMVEMFGTTRGVDQLYALLAKGWDGIEQIVIEDYIVRSNPKQGGFDHSWSKVATLRYIGAIDFRFRSAGIPVFLYPPSNKPAAYGMLGLKYKKGEKDMHHWDAIVHGFKHLELKKIVPVNRIYGAMSGKSIH